MHSCEAMLAQLETLVMSAGEAVMAIYQSDFTVTSKQDQSPLTEADLAANAIIHRGLQEISTWPILSEEDKHIPWQQRQTWSHYWLVDPIDGTKEFINQSGEFTLNIALIENGRPVLSVVYAPALKVLYSAAQKHGAWKTSEQMRHTLDVNTLANHYQRALVSRSHTSKEAVVLSAVYPVIEFVCMGSSLKLCAVVDGQADIYLRLGPTSEWDTAAAQCVVECAGGHVLTSQLQSLTYNQKDSLLNPAFVVSRTLDTQLHNLF